MELFNFELIGYLAAIFTTISFLPQAILIIRKRDTRSLSLEMYSLFTFGVFLWLIYGIYKVDYALIAANSITMLLALTILLFKIFNLKKEKH